MSSTSPDWQAVARVLVASWPGQVSAWGDSALAAFLGELRTRGLTPARAIAAVRAHPGTYGPPTAGELAGIAERLEQGDPPSFVAAHRVIARHITRLDYHRPASTFGTFVALLVQGPDGHEAIGRFAVDLGPEGVRAMPDPVLGDPYTVGAAARAYTATVRAWETDPTRGLAVTEAALAIAEGRTSDLEHVGHLRAVVETPPTA